MSVIVLNNDAENISVSVQNDVQNVTIESNPGITVNVESDGSNNNTVNLSNESAVSVQIASENVLNVTVQTTGARGPAGSVEETFESVSKNIKAWPSTFSYSSGVLQSITFAKDSESVTKSFNYTSGKITSVTLSGDTPESIPLTKSISYSGSQITSVSYL